MRNRAKVTTLVGGIIDMIVAILTVLLGVVAGLVIAAVNDVVTSGAGSEDVPRTAGAEFVNQLAGSLGGVVNAMVKVVFGIFIAIAAILAIFLFIMALRQLSISRRDGEKVAKSGGRAGLVILGILQLVFGIFIAVATFAKTTGGEEGEIATSIADSSKGGAAVMIVLMCIMIGSAVLKFVSVNLIGKTKAEYREQQRAVEPIARSNYIYHEEK